MPLLSEETKRKLRELNLSEMIEAIDQQSQDIGYSTLSFEDRMKLAIDFVYQKKYNSKVQRLIKIAKFRMPSASFSEIYYTQRNLDKEKLLVLSTGQFLETNSSVIFQGFSGSGKSYLACALGKQMCLQGIRTRYIRIPDLLMLRDEAMLKPQGNTKFLKKFSNYNVLILDEWLFDIMSDEEQHFIFELIERRHDNGSTIFCTQFKKVDWHQRLGGGVHADAIMDRIVHNAAWIYSGDINMRQLFAENVAEKQNQF
jgi:DNA replication protein DnaC